MSDVVQQPKPASIAADARLELPRLVFFSSSTSGECRRAEGWIAQVMQSRRNHRKVKLVRVDSEARPDLVERFAVTQLPTLVVVDQKVARGRLERPRNTQEIWALLAPWLQTERPDGAG
jgi:thioredoxin-like negative regulator of GroEL